MEYSLETQKVFTSTNFRQYRLKTPTMELFTQLSHVYMGRMIFYIITRDGKCNQDEELSSNRMYDKFKSDPLQYKLTSKKVVISVTRATQQKIAGKDQSAKLCRQAGADSVIDLRVENGSSAQRGFKFHDNQKRPQSKPNPEIVSQV